MSPADSVVARLANLGIKVFLGILWFVAGTLFLVGVQEALEGPRVAAQALLENPVETQAQVTQVFIDGFGGDPAVDYHFDVDEKTFIGWGKGFAHVSRDTQMR